MMRLLRLDVTGLLRDRLAMAVLAVGVLACVVAVITGRAWSDRLAHDHAQALRASAEQLAETRESWAAAPAGPLADAVLVPTRTYATTPLRLPLLPDFSVGRSSLEPTAASMRLATRADALFVRYQVENPERLARSILDLAFVAVVLAPLLLIGLGYGVFTADRDSGVARLWLAQAGSPGRLLAVRSLTRVSLVYLPIVLAGLALLQLGPDTAGRSPAATLWLAAALVGLLFWWAVILLVNSLRVGAETAALTLVGLWVLLVFVVPTATASTAALLNPPPSRFEQIAAARRAEIQTSREWDDDHPELSSSSLEGRRSTVEKGIEVRAAVAGAVAPLSRTYEERLAAQQDLLARLAVLSPPTLTAEALASVSRTDGRFYAAQRGAVTQFLAAFAGQLADASLGRRGVDTASYDALPRFMPPPYGRARLGPLWAVLLLTAVAGAWAVLRLRRIQPL